MNFYKVEVDETVYQYVKKHAEPFVDSFNSTLKRLLFKDSSKPGRANQRKEHSFATHLNLPSFPSSMPVALRHTLEVVSLVRDGSYDRRSATQFVAKQYGVFPQTVLDKYCRQLNLKASDFDRYLDEPGLRKLKGILLSKYPDYEGMIDEVMP